jgi:hypothetical protein
MAVPAQINKNNPAKRRFITLALRMNVSAETLEYRGNSVITTESPKDLRSCVAENSKLSKGDRFN